MNNQTIMQVAMYVNDLLDEDKEQDKNKAFYMAREKFDNLPGMDKAMFFELFSQCLDSHGIPLLAAARRMAAEEERIKGLIIDCLYATETDDPDRIRTLLDMSNGIKSDNPGRFKASLVYCLDIVGSELAGDMMACWPRDCGVDDA